MWKKYESQILYVHGVLKFPKRNENFHTSNFMWILLKEMDEWKVFKMAAAFFNIAKTPKNHKYRQTLTSINRTVHVQLKK